MGDLPFFVLVLIFFDCLLLGALVAPFFPAFLAVAAEGALDAPFVPFFPATVVEGALVVVVDFFANKSGWSAAVTAAIKSRVAISRERQKRFILMIGLVSLVLR